MLGIRQSISLQYESGVSSLAESFVDKNGATIMVRVDDQLARSEELLTLLLVREFVGQGVMKYFDTQRLPSGVGSDLSAFRGQLATIPGAAEVFSQLLAHIIAADFFANGLSQRQKAAFADVLADPLTPREVRDRLQLFMKSVGTAGGAKSQKQLFEEYLAFVGANSFHGHSDTR